MIDELGVVGGVGLSLWGLRGLYLALFKGVIFVSASPHGRERAIQKATDPRAYRWQVTFFFLILLAGCGLLTISI
jgi:hypothetical protein